jgi:hypothetical protein
MPYESRTGAVLFAKNLDRVVHVIADGGSVACDVTAPPARRATAAFKPVFFVASISRLRGIAETHGGVLEPVDEEWSFNGVKVCDGLDPEGNVIQFREDAGRA